MLQDLLKEMKRLSDPEKAKLLQRFFKTGKGEYGEGDVFLGIMVPEQRRIAKKYSGMSLNEVQQLLKSHFHEHRLVALLILIIKYKNDKKTVYDFYLKNFKYINNWDLVDLSAPNIVGEYLFSSHSSRKILEKWAKSSHLWTRRIAVLSTFTFIRNKQYSDSFRIAKMLLKDNHDLIHKAVGWMLREVGKKDQHMLEQFLIKHCKTMPRTMLRYAIEKFDEKKRKHYLVASRQERD